MPSATSQVASTSKLRSITSALAGNQPVCGRSASCQALDAALGAGSATAWTTGSLSVTEVELANASDRPVAASVCSS